MFWAEIHLQPERHVIEGNNVHKNVTILHNFDSGSMIQVIQQVKKKVA